MLLCKNCNKQFDDDSTFCDECGSGLSSVISCPACNNLIDAETSFCPNCGTTISDCVEHAENEPNKPQKRKFVKMLLAISIPCVAVILAVTIVLLLFINKKKSENYVFYIKDGEVYFSHTLGIKPSQVTENLDATGDATAREFANFGSYSAGQYFRLSENGRYIFFIDEINTEEDEGFTLFYCKANNPGEKSEKIDDNILYYDISANGKCVTYLKDYEYDDESYDYYGTLYQSDLKESDKIDNDVTEFYASDDGKILYYITVEDDLYRVDGKKKDKLASDITNVYHIDEKFETIYYTKAGALYKQVENDDAEKIASDVYSVPVVYDSGELYYVTGASQNASLLDYVEDDMLESDAAITAPTKPVKPEYPSYYNYDTYAEYNAARDAYSAEIEKYNDAYAKYLEKYSIYQSKLDRDELRNDLKNASFLGAAHSLYYYDGDESVLLSDTYNTYSEYAQDAAVMVFSSYNQTKVEKVKLSEVTTVYEVQSMVEATLTSSYSYYVATADKTTLVDCEKVLRFRVDNDGESIYFINGDNDEEGNLYYIAVSGNDVSKPEYFDNNVYIYSCYFAAPGKFLYYKNYNTDKNFGELYINGKKVDDDVHYGRYIEETDTVVYITDWSEKNDCGTLNIYRKGKNTKIEDDVYSFSVTPGGEILYLYDYDLEDYEGELYVYKNNKSKFIDDKVNCIIPYIDSAYINYYYD